MTVPVLSLNEFIDFIKDNGWVISTTDYWEKYNRIIFSKNGDTYTFQCKEKYFYVEVVKICGLLGINPPTEHIHSYYQHQRLNEEPCYCDNGKSTGIKFKDCHGKEN